MDFLNKDQKLKIIPGNIKGVSNGVVKNYSSDHFEVQLDNPSECLNINESIEIIIPVDNTLIKFETKITRIDGDTVYFSLPEKTKFIQRREYIRIDVEIPVELKDVTSDKNINSVAKNLSGGGMQVVSSDSFDIGSLLEAQFTIFDKKNIKAVMEILRTGKDNENYSIAGQFKNISSSDRAAIIQLCFKRQLESRCKDLDSD